MHPSIEGAGDANRGRRVDNDGGADSVDGAAHLFGDDDDDENDDGEEEEEKDEAKEEEKDEGGGDDDCPGDCVILSDRRNATGTRSIRIDKDGDDDDDDDGDNDNDNDKDNDKDNDHDDDIEDEDEAFSGGDSPENHFLSWRLPPDESHSDWTVAVRTSTAATEGTEATSTTTTTTTATLYHVHKVILSLGPRRSEYFASLFRQASASTASNSAALASASSLLPSSSSAPIVSTHRGARRTSAPLRDGQDEVDGRKDDDAMGVASTLASSRTSVVRLAESATSTSEIELEPSAADAFPVLLDYIYSPHAGPPLTTDTFSSSPSSSPSSSSFSFFTPANSVALIHLSRYFGVRSLLSLAVRHVKSTLGPDTAPLYLSESSRYGEGRVFEWCRKACAARFEDVSREDLAGLTPDLVQAVMTSSKLKCPSEILSLRLAEYCRGCRWRRRLRRRKKDEGKRQEGADGHENDDDADADADFFVVVTRAGIMPRIHPDAALYLLSLSASLGLEESSLRRRCVTSCSSVWRDVAAYSSSSSTEEEVRGRQDRVPLRRLSLPSSSSSSRPAAVSSLSFRWPRCTPPPSSSASQSSHPHFSSRAQASALRSAQTIDDDLRQASYASLPHTFKIDVLETSLRSAAIDMDAMSAARQREDEAFRSRLAERDAEIDRLRGVAVSKAKQIRDLLSSLRSKENEIQTCEAELGRYVRVPKEYRGFGNLKACTFTEQRRRREVIVGGGGDGDGGDDGGVYGEEPPTSMPLLGSSEREGYLYLDAETGALWPVFYYKCPYH